MTCHKLRHFTRLRFGLATVCQLLKFSQFVYATTGKLKKQTPRATQLAVRFVSVLNGQNELFTSRNSRTAASKSLGLIAKSKST